MSPPDPAAIPRRGRRLRRAFVVAAVLVTFAGMAWWTGRPQRAAFEKGMEQGLGGRAEVSGVRIWPEITLDSLRIYNSTAQQFERNATVSLDGLNVVYRIPELFKSGGRGIERVSMRSLGLNVDGTDPAATTYDFLVPLLTGPPSDNPLRFAPKDLAIDRLDVNLAMPSMRLRFEGPRVAARIQALDNLAFTVDGRAIRGHYAATAPPLDIEFDDGTIQIEVHSDGNSFRATPLVLHMPGIIDIDGALTLERSPLRWDFAIEKGSLQSVDLSNTPEHVLPFGIRVEMLDLSGSHVRGAVSGSWVALGESTLDVRATQLVLGPQDAPWYAGDLALEGSGQGDAIDVTLTLNDGQRLHLAAKGNLDNATARVQLDQWQRGALTAVLPDAWRGHLDWTPHLSTLSIEAETVWARPVATVEGQSRIEFDDGTTRDSMTVEAHTVSDLVSNVSQMRVRVALGDGGADVQIAAAPSEPPRVTGTLTAFPAGRLFRQLPLPEILAGMQSAIDGTVGYTMNDAAHDVAVDVAARPVPFITYPLPGDGALRAKGTVSVLQETGLLRGSDWEVRLGTDADVQLRRWEASLDPLDVEADLEGNADLGAVAGRMELGPLGGVAAVKSSVRYRGDIIELRPWAEIDGLRYGGLGLSFGRPVTAEGQLRYHVPDGTGVFESLVARIGTATEIRFDEPSFRIDPLEVRTGIQWSGDLAPLIDLGFLAAADGHVEASGTLAFGEHGLEARIDAGAVEAYTLELPNKLARLSGARIEGAGGYDEGFSGEWRVGASRVEAAGLVFSDLFGVATLSGLAGHLHIESGRFYDGRILLSDLRTSFAGTDIGLSGSVQFREVDLETFTREFEPPGTRLTGKVTGVLRFAMVGGEMTRADIRVRAPNGFSLNKDLIREQLLRQTVSDATFGLFFGEGEDGDPLGQRHFDSAEIELALVPAAAEFRGEAKMLSRELRLVMPMTIDMRVITEAIKARQRTQLENMENVQQQPVEFTGE